MACPHALVLPSWARGAAGLGRRLWRPGGAQKNFAERPVIPLTPAEFWADALRALHPPGYLAAGSPA